MTAPVDRHLFESAIPAELELGKLRSDCIDAFAALETAAYRIASILRIETDSKGQLSQLIKKLKATAPSPQLSKENAGKLKGCCDEVIRLLGQRADIVHSQMTVVPTDDGFIALFRNAHAAGARLPDARVYDGAMLEDLSKQTRTLAVKLSQITNKPKPITINPASSPPPPSPDAAGGP